ncbi:MAG: flagellar hook-basal body complex protein FliE [Burkholderiaceae bacterium]
MELRLAPVTGAPTLRPASALRPADGAKGGGFADALSGALQSVSALQDQSTGLQQQVQLENPNVSLEETMLSIQKAQIGFQATLHVRNRLVQAYSDIMNMQV